MSYADAPSTLLLATHCALCGLPLRDAPSIEAGIGPVCAERAGLPHGGDLSPERAEANRLIHRVAVLQCEGPEVRDALDTLVRLGFDRVAERLRDRLAELTSRAEIVIHDAGLVLEVRTPKPTAAQLDVMRAIPGRRYDRERRLNIIPKAAKRQLFEALTLAFPGVRGVGPRGLFTLKGASHGH